MKQRIIHMCKPKPVGSYSLYAPDNGEFLVLVTASGNARQRRLLARRWKRKFIVKPYDKE